VSEHVFLPCGNAEENTSIRLHTQTIKWSIGHIRFTVGDAAARFPRKKRENLESNLVLSVGKSAFS
jgi:hypothetical protein